MDEHTEQDSLWPIPLLLDGAQALSAGGLERILAEKLGPVTEVMFWDLGNGRDPRWTGYRNGEGVGGDVRCRCVAYEPDHLIAWTEITLDSTRPERVVARFASRIAASALPDGVRRRRKPRLELIAERGRELLRQLKQKPRVATPDVVAAVAAMIELAEGGRD